MAYYRTCPYCNSHLDPGERCDCQEEGGGNRKNELQGDVVHHAAVPDMQKAARAWFDARMLCRSAGYHAGH